VPKRVDHEERRQRIADALVRSAATRGLHATGMLPTDDQRRAFNVVYLAYLALSLTDPALAISPLVRNSAAVVEVIAAQLRTAQAAGDAPAGLDPDMEALTLMSMSSGLGTSVLAGHSTPDQAQAVIDYQLRRLFPS